MPAEELRLDVLVVDDHVQVVRVIQRGLEREGHTVDYALSGEDGLEKATAKPYDAVILDVMLPGISGFQVAARLRDRGVTTPILMLTQRDTERDVIQGLEHGADAYLPKPFRIGELEARLLALKRRVGMDAQTLLRFEDLEMDRVGRVVRRDGAEVPLTKIEFKLLETLMLRPGRLFSREEILARVWGAETDLGAGALHVHVGNLRKKLEMEGRRRVIQTVRSRGYRLSTIE